MINVLLLKINIFLCFIILKSPLAQSSVTILACCMKSVAAGVALSVYRPAASRTGLRNPMEQLFTDPFEPGPRPTQPPVQWVRGILPRGKRPGRCFDHLQPSTVEAENGYSKISASSLCPLGILRGSFYPYKIIPHRRFNDFYLVNFTSSSRN
jgi:hypothetical protein